MLKESQRLHYVVTEVQGPSIKAEFTDCKASIQLPMEKVKYDQVFLCPFLFFFVDISVKKMHRFCVKICHIFMYVITPAQVDFEPGKGLMLSSMLFSFLPKRKDLGVFHFIALSYTSWTLSSPFFPFLIYF